jgi:putative membrane protein
MIRLAYIIFSLVLLVIGILFAVLNAEPVTLHYYFNDKQIPLSLVLVSSIIIGALLGVIASAGIIIKLKRDNSRLKKSSELSEKELSNLRTMPIKDKH